MIYPSYYQTVLAVTIISFLEIVTPGLLQAHGVGYRILESENCVTLEAYYSSGEPMSYSSVQVFSPEHMNIEYQKGRTDKQGRFTFLPNITGFWRIEINDGRGHRIQDSIVVDRENGMQHISPSETRKNLFPKGWGTVFGVSLIFNFCCLLGLFKKWPTRKTG